MSVTKVAAGENGFCFEDEAAGGQEAAHEFSKLMVSAMYASLKESGTSQELEQSFLQKTGGKLPGIDRPYSQLELDLIHDLSATAGSVADKPEMQQLAALIDVVSELLDNGGMTENQRQAAASILAALRNGTSNPEAIGNAIVALGKLSQDGFTEVDAQEVMRVLTGKSDGSIPGTGTANADSETPGVNPPNFASGVDKRPESGMDEEAAAAPAPPPAPAPAPALVGQTQSATVSPPLPISQPGTLADNQQALRDALIRQGATPDEVRLAMGIQLVESNDGISHDTGKDGNTDGSRNFSPLNINEQALRINWTGEDLVSLNRPNTAAQWDRVADAFLSCVRAEGQPVFIHHLRDGYGEHRPDTTADYMKGLNAQMSIWEAQGAGARANVHVNHI